jgi:hypothetical protein
MDGCAPRRALSFLCLVERAGCRFVPPETLPTPHLSSSPARKLLHLQSGALLVLAKVAIHYGIALLNSDCTVRESIPFFPV